MEVADENQTIEVDRIQAQPAQMLLPGPTLERREAKDFMLIPREKASDQRVTKSAFSVVEQKRSGGGHESVL